MEISDFNEKQVIRGRNFHNIWQNNHHIKKSISHYETIHHHRQPQQP